MFFKLIVILKFAWINKKMLIRKIKLILIVLTVKIYHKIIDIIIIKIKKILIFKNNLYSN